MFEEVSPVKKGLVAAVFLFCIAVGVFTKTYLPYNQYMKIEMYCTQETNATVVEFEQPQNDDIFFFGPMVEFETDDRVVRTYAINTVDPKEKHSAGEIVTIRYNPSMLSDVLILEDDDIKRQFRLTSIIAGALCAGAFISVIIGIALNDPGPKIKTYFLNQDGKTFEQWQEMQKLKNDAENAQPELENKVRLDKEEHGSQES